MASAKRDPALQRRAAAAAAMSYSCNCCNNTTTVWFLLAQCKMASYHTQTGAGGAGCLVRPNIEPHSLGWKEQTGFGATWQPLTPLPNTANSKDFSPTGPLLFSSAQSSRRESQQPSFPPNVCAAKSPPVEFAGKMSTPKFFPSPVSVLIGLESLWWWISPIAFSATMADQRL